MSVGVKKACTATGLFLAMVLAALAGLLVEPNAAPLVVSLLVFSVWGAGLLSRALGARVTWQVCWILGCVIGVAAATTSMGVSVLGLVVGIFVTLAVTGTAIWTALRWIDSPPPATHGC
jgi:hypothetical protein